ncbi:MAG: putative RNA methyltransferase [Candidatus Dojkabacteria bacterium]|nr:MAG: putative RNA methyltransferase [Candidatus Dojkabacteria bacterium]
MSEKIVVYIEKIVLEGKGFGVYHGIPVYVIGALPEETVEAEVFRAKKDFKEAILSRVIQPSPYRILPQEDHYLSCSPWQTMDYLFQIKQKENIIRTCFKRFADLELPNFELVPSPDKFHYRNKIEFSFGEDGNGVFLAYHRRGSHKNMCKLNNGCVLAHPSINEKARIIFELIKQSGVQEFDLKSLIVRSSKFEQKSIAILLVKNEKERVQRLIEIAKSYPIDDFGIALSSYKNPTPTIDKILYRKGSLTLKEKVNHLILEYSIDSFFQNHIPLFEIALNDIAVNIKPNQAILELYSGVGSIGLFLADKSTKVTGVESVKNAVHHAYQNAQSNKITNYYVISSLAEKVDRKEFINISTLIVDPPRTGLHKKVRKLILESKPEQIVYLSCNPITQANDYNNLKEFYDLTFIKAYDFYPQTPHIESLIILKRK